MARWHSCNVLQVEADKRRVWQFDARNFSLSREQTASANEPLPSALVGKSWGTMFQPKLNIAWLPPEHVFFRVAHFPPASFEETRSMVELQLEKLSPLPVTQALWTMEILPASVSSRRVAPNPASPPATETENLQTVIVIIVARSVVEEFLGKIELQGFLADRLDLPLLDELQSAAVTEDGAWIYPGGHGGNNTALVAWWYGGMLQNLDLLLLPNEGNRAASLKEQLMQMAWAGELEGWLTSPPRWHLVADAATAATWEPVLREGSDQSVDIVPPAPAADLAARTAKRSVQADGKINLLPPEYATRYQQQFVDRLWTRGVLAVLGLYAIGLAIYFVAVGVLNFQTKRVEADVASRSGAYTNSVRLEQRFNILKNRQELKFAALNSWEAVAETMPDTLTLDSLNFSDGHLLRLSGTANDPGAVIDFSDKLRRYTISGQPLFDVAHSDAPHIVGGRWTYELQLNRTEKR